MDAIPKVSFKTLTIGDVIKGQDGNKYVVSEEANILYWKPYVENASNVDATPAPTPRPTPTAAPVIKKTKEKYYWKDNNKKPEYEGNNMDDMVRTLKPKVSPNKFPTGYVWTTKFRNISYIVDVGYLGYSTKLSKLWVYVRYCPPCLDANNYPFKYVHETADSRYYVEYDEQGNKYWCCVYTCLIPQQAYKFKEGHIEYDSVGVKRVSHRYNLEDPVFDFEYAYWNDENDNDSDDE